MKKFAQSLKARFAPVAATGTAIVAASGSALASGGGGVDVANVVSAIEGAAGPIAQIGAAVLIVMVGIKVYKWVRRAM